MDERELARQDRIVRRQMMQQAGRYGTIGIEFGVGLIFGYYAGGWLDARWGTAPLMTYGLMAGGFMVGVVDLIKLVIRAGRNRDDELEG